MLVLTFGGRGVNDVSYINIDYLGLSCVWVPTGSA